MSFDANIPFVSLDKSLLDIQVIYNFLSCSYWANTRSKEQIIKSIEHSRCYGLYLSNKQIGFARVITDEVVFAYLMDVFIVEEHQGKSYSSILLDRIFNDPELDDVKKWYLRTQDAHGVYEKFGFTALEYPDRSMELMK